jgi:hypothetical protein
LTKTRLYLNDIEVAYLDGLSAFAWWKDGTRYVGTTGTTFTQAVVEYLVPKGFSKEEAEKIARVS